ncbi:Dedicator of cytokinesis protein 1 [Elsinoe australis]|uniref:Alpha-acetolactate decarboxylase n=1 Tax=Elsinoe australis TaxID=40998 RepID=A0A2P8A8W1_9PEZI|nr:Dedicator of cytokinesis protein 1 [Elsinoe australis]
MVSRIPNDIFQFSTVSALMAGLCDSGPAASQLTGYGTHGLGTCSSLNGEVLFLDSVPWHMTTSPLSGTASPPSDQEALNSTARNLSPTIRHADPSSQLPFVQVTLFRPEFTLSLPLPSANKSLTKSSLLSLLSSADPTRGSGGKNSFLPFQITGTFSKLDVRIGGPKQSSEEALSEVTARAPQWRLKRVRGTMFGILSPGWSQGISVAGFHGHFVEDEKAGEGEGGEVRRGGHVLDFEMEVEAEGRVEWGVTGRYHLGMPRGEEWEGLDLSVDAEGIHRAEG